MTIRKITIALVATLLGGAAQADSIKGQENGEIAYCMVETDTMSGLISKTAIDRHNACLKAHGWLPGSGDAKILQHRYVAQANAAFAKGEAMANAVISALARCRAISGTDVPASSMTFSEYTRRSEIYAACRTAAGL
jgi:hypothetical protein